MIFWYIGITLAIGLWTVYTLVYTKTAFQQISHWWIFDIDEDDPIEFGFASLTIVILGLFWWLVIPITIIVGTLYLIWYGIVHLRTRDK